MQQRIALSSQVFYAALCFMLGTAVASATIWSAAPRTVAGLTLIGAITALGARLRYHRLRRAARHADTLVDLGGYPMHLLRDPRFTARRRNLA